jgi:hypothetical protein
MKGFVKMKEALRQMNSASTDVALLNGMARALERSEARRAGTTLTQARKSVARRVGVTASAFENFLYQRTKVVPSWLMHRVRAELISVLQLEVQNLEHEIQLHRQTGSAHSDDALASAETQLEAARQILSGEVR